MKRIAWAFPIAAAREDDVRETAEEFRNAAFEDYARSRRDLGLERLDIWLQHTEGGPVVILLVEGDLERYFAEVKRATGVDGWFGDKLREWGASSGRMSPGSSTTRSRSCSSAWI